MSVVKVCENGAIDAYNAFLLPIMYKGSVPVPLLQNLSITYGVKMVTVEEQYKKFLKMD